MTTEEEEKRKLWETKNQSEEEDKTGNLQKKTKKQEKTRNEKKSKRGKMGGYVKIKERIIRRN